MTIQFDSKNLVHLPIDEIKPNPKNRNKHPEEQIERLRKLIEYQGFRQPLIVSNQTGMLVVGHGRLIAAQRMGMKTVPVIYQDFESAEQEFAFAVSDNAIASWSELEMEKITDDLEGFNLDLDLLGIKDFSLSDIDGLNQEEDETEAEEEEREPGCDEDEIPEPSPEPSTRLGDVYELGKHTLTVGDNLEMLKTLDDNSVDSLVTDPPAGITFMGKEWDDDKGGRKQWTAWLGDVMKECLRVMKPGAHGLVWAIPRTSHWTATALEDAGFEIRDVVTHIFGSGFPKSLDISKAIDKAAGLERKSEHKPNYKNNVYGKGMGGGEWNAPSEPPKTPEAKQWAGWGTALKPASEHWVLVRKPISANTVADNVLEHGTGGINIDASRISTNETLSIGSGKMGYQGTNDPKCRQEQHVQGRFPANLVLSHNSDCVEVGTKKVKSDAHYTHNRKSKGGSSWSHGSKDGEDFGNPLANNEDGTETVSAWECTEGCAVEMLDEQSGWLVGAGNKNTKSPNKKNDGSMFGVGSEDGTPSVIYDRGGGASRFFYCSKASGKDKGEGNTHPTVKSTALMSYFIKMVTPPNGLVLDVFGGSGTTLITCEKLGFKCNLVELAEGHCDIIINRWCKYSSRTAYLIKPDGSKTSWDDIKSLKRE